MSGLRFHLLLTAVMVGACGDKAAETGAPGADTGAADPCAVEDPTLSVLEIAGLPGCGAPIFAATCSGCHGPDGGGTEAGPDLAEHVANHPDVELAVVIMAGTGDMPAQPLDNAQAAHVLAWLRAEFGEYDGTGH